MSSTRTRDVCKAESDRLVLTEEYDNVTVEVKFKGGPQPAIKRNKKKSSDRRTNGEISGREHHLWSFLKELKDCVDWAAGGADRRIAGLLWVGSIRRLIDLENGRETDPRIMRACMRSVVRTASDAEITEFAEFACRTEPREPDPHIIGRDLLYTQQEWHSNREPRKVWPYGRTRVWVEKFFAAKDKARERERGRRRRQAAGATPREESLAECARVLGKDPKTVRKYLKMAGYSVASARTKAKETGIDFPCFVRSLIESEFIPRSRTKTRNLQRPRRQLSGCTSDNRAKERDHLKLPHSKNTAEVERRFGIAVEPWRKSADALGRAAGCFPEKGR